MNIGTREALRAYVAIDLEVCEHGFTDERAERFKQAASALLAALDAQEPRCICYNPGTSAHCPVHGDAQEREVSVNPDEPGVWYMIERGTHEWWAGTITTGVLWTRDPIRAIHFCRKQDADAVIAGPSPSSTNRREGPMGDRKPMTLEEWDERHKYGPYEYGFILFDWSADRAALLLSIAQERKGKEANGRQFVEMKNLWEGAREGCAALTARIGELEAENARLRDLSDEMARQDRGALDGLRAERDKLVKALKRVRDWAESKTWDSRDQIIRDADALLSRYSGIV